MTNAKCNGGVSNLTRTSWMLCANPQHPCPVEVVFVALQGCRWVLEGCRTRWATCIGQGRG